MLAYACALLPKSNEEENVCKVMEAVGPGQPVLLQGGTGIGKTATVQEAAARQGKRLIRHNMSSRVELDDFYGRARCNDTDKSGDTWLQISSC